VVDLSFIQEASTLGIVDKAIQDQEAGQEPRSYLGMSEIGDECSRRLWLKYHTGAKEIFKPQLLRLFRTGKLLEEQIIKDLRAAGFTVSGQQEVFKDFDGKFKGHCDGIISGIPESKKEHILEIKTSNAKNFTKFQKSGIAAHEIYGAKYVAQAQCYMGYANLDRALFIIENKNTSERYQERLRFDRKLFQVIQEKARQIIESKFPPDGISIRQEYYKCQWCSFNNGDQCRKIWPGEPAF
jgi:hypothetical protein